MTDAGTIKRIVDRAHDLGAAYTVVEYRWDRDRAAIDRGTTWLLDSRCIAMEETDAGLRPTLHHADYCRCDRYMDDATRRRREQETR